MPEPYAVELVIMATLGCSPAVAHETYIKFEPILINLNQAFPLAKGMVTATVLNVRETPNVKAISLGTLTKGNLVTIWGRTVDGTWLAIEKPQGWVSSQFVQETSP
jgi:hypothetical protein